MSGFLNDSRNDNLLLVISSFDELAKKQCIAQIQDLLLIQSLKTYKVLFIFAR